MSISNPHGRGESCSRIGTAAAITLIATLGASQARAAPDWAGLDPLAETYESDGSSTYAVARLKAQVEGDRLFVFVDSARVSESYNLFFDTDGSPLVGFKSKDWPAYSGADALYSWGIYRYNHAMDPTGKLWAFERPQDAPPDPPRVAVDSELGTAYQFEIPLSDIHADPSAPTGIGIGFEWTIPVEQENGETTSEPYLKVPAREAFARLTPEGAQRYDVENCRYEEPKPAPLVAVPACENGRTPESTVAAYDAGVGAIIPAYFAHDSDSWNVLVAGARALAATDATFDYWITLNADNGPPASDSRWQDFAPAWDALQTDGRARLFGYVHACPEGKCIDSTQLLPIEDVLRAVSEWVCHYPSLSGIWLDEFYPQFEITTLPKSDSLTPQLDKVPQATPLDRCFLNYDGSINPNVQAMPYGGYFDQLIRAIRERFPNLKIIGNVGGSLYGNLHEYGALVDVLVSYEDSYERATMLGGAHELKVTPDAGDCQLALVHGVPRDRLGDSLSRSFALGFTHVWMTDRPYVNEKSNTWGIAPSFLKDEIETLFGVTLPAQ